ncbi:DUF5372 family protein [Cystobacter ferrugineus]|uniref:DUF5372 family protein n=1 Tax=Cystobacter ferrugineus TaxID=83449 RepID=UPI003CCBB894
MQRQRLWKRAQESPQRRTPLKTQPSRDLVVITHPLHPFVGRAFPVQQRLRYLGRPSVVLLFPDGRLARVPEDWTDLRPRPPPLEVRGKCPKLHPESLRELSALLDDLRNKSRPHDQEGSASDEKRQEPVIAGRALRRTPRGGPARAVGRAGRRAAQGRHQGSRRKRGKR